MIDFALPMPRFEAARLIGITEIVLYSFLFSKLLFRRPLGRWNAIRYLGATGATFVNLHTFPLMGWYTTDGLVCVAIGLALIDAGMRRERAPLMWLGMVALGSAPLMKQSFAVAPLIGLAYIAWRSRPHRGWVRRAFIAAMAGGVPILAYLVFLGVFGAAGPFLQQVGGAEFVWGKSFFTAFTNRNAGVQMLFFTGLALAGFLMVSRSRRRNHDDGSQGASVVAIALRAALSALLIVTPIAQKFSFAQTNGAVAQTWGFMLTWAVVALVVIKAIFERVSDAIGMTLVALAWMTSLSWGYPFPNLVAGTLLLFLLQDLWSGVAISRRIRGAAISAAAAALVIVSAFLVVARNDAPYFDRPRGELTESLRSVSPEFGGIKTSFVTATYLRQIRACVDSHPARWVAFLPDNPGIYPALKLRNPFPIDWMFPDEVAEESTRIGEAARTLDREGDYLVMFQTVSFGDLPALKELPPAGATSAPFFYNTEAGRRIIANLHGESVTCGSFLGVHKPRSPS